MQLFWFEYNRPCRFEDDFYYEQSCKLHAKEDLYYYITFSSNATGTGGELTICAIEYSSAEMECIRDKVVLLTRFNAYFVFPLRPFLLTLGSSKCLARLFCDL